MLRSALLGIGQRAQGPGQPTCMRESKERTPREKLVGRQTKHVNDPPDKNDNDNNDIVYVNV